MGFTELASSETSRIPPRTCYLYYNEKDMNLETHDLDFKHINNWQRYKRTVGWKL